MKIEQITFNNVNIDVAVIDDRPCIALKPIAEALGLEWPRQTRIISEDAVLSSVIAKMATTGADGKQYEMLCLPLDYLNGWLFKINANRYKGERRDLIIRYQKECYRVLAQHFLPVLACLEEVSESDQIQPASLDQLHAAIEKAAAGETAQLRYDLSLFVRSRGITGLGELMELARDVMSHPDRSRPPYFPGQMAVDRWRGGSPHPETVRRCLERAIQLMNTDGSTERSFPVVIAAAGTGKTPHFKR